MLWCSDIFAVDLDGGEVLLEGRVDAVFCAPAAFAGVVAFVPAIFSGRFFVLC